jgi:hypothetical protein
MEPITTTVETAEVVSAEPAAVSATTARRKRRAARAKARASAKTAGSGEKGRGAGRAPSLFPNQSPSPAYSSKIFPPIRSQAAKSSSCGGKHLISASTPPGNSGDRTPFRQTRMPLA